MSSATCNCDRACSIQCVFDQLAKRGGEQGLSPHEIEVDALKVMIGQLQNAREADAQVIAAVLELMALRIRVPRGEA